MCAKWTCALEDRHQRQILAVKDYDYFGRVSGVEARSSMQPLAPPSLACYYSHFVPLPCAIDQSNITGAKSVLTN